MEKKTLYVIVAIVVVLALVLGFSNLTGRGVTYTCSDTDGGDNPNTPGTVTYGATQYKDICEITTSGQKKFLKEKYCLDIVTTNRYLCEDGCAEDVNGVGYCLGEADLQSDK